MATKKEVSTLDRHHEQGLATEAASTTMLSTSSNSTVISSEPSSASASIWNVIFNLTNVTLGSGALAIPWCLRLTGLAGGSLILVLAALLSGTSSYLFSRAGSALGEISYVGVAKALYGKLGERMVMVMLLLLIQAPMTVYETVLGDYFFQVLPSDAQSSFPSRSVGQLACMVVVSLGVVFPLSCFPRFSMLGNISVVSVLCVFAIAGMIALEYAYNDSPVLMELKNVQWWILPTGGETSGLSWVLRLNALPTAIFCFINHVTVLEIFSEMKKPTQARKSLALGVTNGISCVVYLVIGVFGYLTFGETLGDNVLLQPLKVLRFPSHFQVAMGMMACVVTLSLPLFVFPSRQCFLWVLDDFISSLFPKLNLSWQNVSTQTKTVLSTLFILAFSIFLATRIHAIGIVLSLFASVLGSLVVLILPGLFFLKAIPSEKRGKVETAGGVLLIVSGLVILLLGTTLSLLLLWHTDAIAPTPIP